MDSGQNIEGDRLSSLPNDLIHKILSFVSIKEAIQTSVLSSSWRFIWTSLPYLCFSSEDFDTPHEFDCFVTHVLSYRDNQIEVSSIELNFHGDITEELVKKVVDYAFSHNVQQLTITNDAMGFPLPIFLDTGRMDFSLSPSLTLKHLKLKSFEVTSTWEFPALTTLYLSHMTLDVDNVCLFSKCPNLKNLTLTHFTMERSSDGSNMFDLCHSGLSNLRLENVGFGIDVMNLIAPQLKNLSLVRVDDDLKTAVLNLVAPQLQNLTIRDWPPIRLNLLSAPELGSYSPCVLRSLDKADISINYTIHKEAHKIASLLQQLQNVKHLTLTWDFIQLLSSFMEIISHQPSPFANLKSLKVYPCYSWSNVEETMPNWVKKYLLDGSPDATFTMVSSQEMMAFTSAQKSMDELQTLLETSRAYMDLGKAPMESNEPSMHGQGNAQVDNMQQHDNLGRMSEIISCWEDLNVQIKKGKEMTYDIISKLHRIERLLTNLPASKKPKIQACYSSLRAEAHTVINSIIDCMNIKCNEKQSRLSVCYRELNTGPIEPPPPISSPVVNQLHQNMGRYPSDLVLYHQWCLPPAGHHYISPASSWT